MHQVVIIGSGLAGIKAAKKLNHPSIHVTIISKTNHHLFKPMIYQVATGLISPGEVAPTNRDVLRKNRNITIHTGAVQDINPQNKYITWTNGAKTYQTHYDILLVATGAETSYFGHDEYRNHTYNLKTLDDALVLKAKIFSSLELAEAEENEAERNKLLTFVIVGAGPIGIELCGQMHEIFSKSLTGKFTNFSPLDIKIIIVEGAPYPLPAFGEEIGRKVAAMIQKLNINIYTNSLVTKVSPDSVTISQKTERGEPREETIDAATIIWSAGTKATALAYTIAQKTGAKQDRLGRLEVNAQLNIENYPEIFILGDVASVPGAGLAQGAFQTAECASKVIFERLKLAKAQGKTYYQAADQTTTSYVYNDKGTMAVVSKFQAVMKTDKLSNTGSLSWILWGLIHLAHTVGFKSIILVILQWLFNFVTGKYNEAFITPMQINAKKTQSDLDLYHKKNPH